MRFKPLCDLLGVFRAPFWSNSSILNLILPRRCIYHPHLITDSNKKMLDSESKGGDRKINASSRW